MDFFEGVSEPVQPEWPDRDDDEVNLRQPEWFAPPADVIGGVLSISEALYRDEHVFIGITDVTAYPTGVSFTLRVAIRRGAWPRDRWAKVEDLFWEDDGLPQRRRGRLVEDRLRVGVELADGRRAVAFPRYEAPPDGDRRPESPLLTLHHGGASGGPSILDARRDVFLWPLPDGEHLDVVADWPALNVPLTQFRIDAAALRAAAGRAQPYWQKPVFRSMARPPASRLTTVGGGHGMGMTVTDPDVPDPANDPRTLQADPGTYGQGADLASAEDDPAATGEDELGHEDSDGEDPSGGAFPDARAR